MYIYACIHIHTYVHMCVCLYYRVFTLQNCGSWPGSLYKAAAGQAVEKQRQARTHKPELEPTRTDWNPWQFLLSLTLMGLVSCRTRLCPSSQSWPRSQRSWKRMQGKEEQLQAWQLPHQQDEPADQQQCVSYIMAAPSLLPSKSSKSATIALAAHPNLKHTGEKTLGNVLQSRLVETLKSYHIPH